MKGSTALVGGLSGATALTLIHETVRRLDPQAPRMDLLGMQSLSRLLKGIGSEQPERSKLYELTLLGDLVGNAIFYSLAAAGRKKGIIPRGILMGLGAGIGAVLLPRPLGLNSSYSGRTSRTKTETMLLYLIGGLVASTFMRLSQKKVVKSKVKEFAKKAKKRSTPLAG